MRKQKEIEYGNFVCKFGEQNLLDYADTVIIPAFNPGDERTVYGSSYFFLNTERLNLGTESQPILAIAGRFIKVTKLVRDQIYDRETRQLVADPATLDTALSAIFILILNDHRLLYVKETAQAPNFPAFANTCQLFFRRQLDTYRQGQLLEQRAAAGTAREQRRINPTSIARQFPAPTVHIEYLGTEETTDKFVDRFRQINTIRIKILPTNNESDNEAFFTSLRVNQQALGATTAQTVFHDKEGMSKEETKSQLKVAAEQGIVNYEVEGIDINGDTLIGNNDDFAVKTPFSGDTDNIPATARSAFKSYQTVFNKKADGKEEQTDASPDKLDRIKGLFDFVEI